jgi:phage/plasmid-like protein (TIGR03299 family)
MASEIETFMSYREKPWHGLGVIVQEAPTSDEAIKLAGLDWDVVPSPIYTIQNDQYKQSPSFLANVRSSDGSILGVVTERYKIIQNCEAFDFTDILSGTDLVYETAGSLNNGKRIFLTAKLKNFKQRILDDEMEYYLVFTNSHDGKGAVKIAITPIRTVCSNTLGLALKQASRTWSAVHSSLLASKMEEAKNTLFMAETYVSALQEEADRLSQVIVPMDTFRFVSESLFPVTKDMSPRQINNAEELKADLATRYAFPDIKKFNGTGWGVIQAVSDLVGHRAPQRDTSTYQEKNFAKIIDGHNLFDKAYDLIRKIG